MLCIIGVSTSRKSLPVKNSRMLVMIRERSTKVAGTGRYHQVEVALPLADLRRGHAAGAGLRRRQHALAKHHHALAKRVTSPVRVRPMYPRPPSRRGQNCAPIQNRRPVCLFRRAARRAAFSRRPLRDQPGLQLCYQDIGAERSYRVAKQLTAGLAHIANASARAGQRCAARPHLQLRRRGQFAGIGDVMRGHKRVPWDQNQCLMA